MTVEEKGPRLSILVPTWNGREILPRCLSSIFASLARASLAFEVVIADDGSTDGTADWLAIDYPHVHLLRLDGRHWFARTVNLGMSRCSGEWVLLLNNDVRVDPEFFAAAVPHLGSRELFGIAPRIVVKEGGREIDESLYAPRLRRGKLEVVPPPPFDGGEPRLASAPVHYLCGAACFLRRAAFQALGGFDELFAPFFWEDVDLSLRAILAGLPIVHEPACIAHHARNTTIRRVGDFSRWSTYCRNQEAFFWKHAAGKRLIAAHVAFLPLRFFRAIAKGDFGLALGLARVLPLLPALVRRRRSDPPSIREASFRAWAR